MVKKDLIPKYKKGDKVVAVRKTSRGRDVDTCASYYQMVELGQDFLYVNGQDEVATKRYKEVCYWCDAVKGTGDSYRESDLKFYEEKS